MKKQDQEFDINFRSSVNNHFKDYRSITFKSNDNIHYLSHYDHNKSVIYKMLASLKMS